jgi:hypothetical protein
VIKHIIQRCRTREIIKKLYTYHPQTTTISEEQKEREREREREGRVCNEKENTPIKEKGGGRGTMVSLKYPTRK